MTRGLIKSSKRKQKLYDKFLKKRTMLNEDNYKAYKTLFESIKLKSKKQHYADRLKQYQFDIKKTWQIIKEVIGNKKTVSSFPKRLISNGEEITDAKTIAEIFNKFFVNVGPKLASAIPNTQRKFDAYINRNQENMKQETLTDKELTDAFLSLKINKSPGYDDISSNVVKNCQDQLFEPLKHIFSISLKEGIFPQQLKIARVSPIFKTGDDSLLTNFRPISVLPCFSKLLERIMYNRLYKFLLEHNILYEKQFGFQHAHATEHAIVQLVDQILQSFNENKYTIGVFIDLSKAFDTVDHEILIKKLESYGIRNLSLNWFRSYLSQRKQFISYEKGKTDYEHILCGVPQGSILGPLLFLIYVNDLKRATKLLDPIMFADDTNLFYSHSNIKISSNL